MTAGDDKLVWRQPRSFELDAPDEIKKQIDMSIYWNWDGKMVGGSLPRLIEYSFFLLVTAIFISQVVIMIPFTGLTSGQTVIRIFSFLLVTASTFYLFYRWGWKNYQEAWYYFNHDDEILTITRFYHDEWETIDIPYETIDSIDWSNETNGYAIINTVGMQFYTNRALDKRMASVTELWDELAKTEAPMHNWPINLLCQQCGRRFGNHTGTAVCPFCGLILVDPSVKGRIDPVEIHDEDKDRV